MFSDDVIHRIRDSIDIVDLVSGYVSLRKTGKNQVGLCPFHAEKTPSFTVNPDRQIFHCFGCGTGGDVYKFIALQEGLNFPEAVRTLARRAGIPLPAATEGRRTDGSAEDERKILLTMNAAAAAYYRRELDGPAGSAAREYLTQRGVSASAVSDFSLGFARPEWDGLLRHLKQNGHALGQMEKAGLIIRRSSGDGYYDRFRGRIMFPIRDLSGNVIAFGGRVMDDSLPKYLNSPETPVYSKSSILYGLDRAKEQGRRLGYFIIVEGYLDAIACHRHGVQNAVATLGTALTEGHLRLLRRFAQKVVLIFDPDPAGVRAALRGLDLFIASGMKANVVSLPEGEDPDTFLRRQGSEAFLERLKESWKLMDFILHTVAQSGSGAGIDEKVEKAAEMISYIAKIPSGIERDYYIKKTAERLAINESLLREEMKEQRSAPGGRSRRPGGTALTQQQRPRAEAMLIHLMLKDEELARAIRAELVPEDFTDPLYQRAAERIFAVLGQTGTLDARSLLEEGNDEVSRLISHYAVLDTEYSDPSKTSRDCIERIKQSGHTKRMQAINAAIKEVEARGDSAELRRLLEEQQRLVQSRSPARGENTISH